MRSATLRILLSILLAAPVCARASDQTPLDVVDKRTRAIAEHNFADFMSTYADDVELFVYPDKPLGKGKEHLRKLFAPLFEKGDVEVTVARQIVSDSFVVSESTLSFGDKSETTVAIYEVRDGLIGSVRFLRDDLRARQTPRQRQGNP
jgi:hypothetical protein